MKTKIFMIALVMGLFTATTAQAQHKMTSDSKSETMTKEMYVCPMHADEKSEKPGKCSQCGMDMKKMEMKKDNMKHGNMNHSNMKGSHKESMSSDMAKGYMCPMKCEGDKTYDKAGKCPKCGMELEKVEGKKESKEHKH